MNINETYALWLTKATEDNLIPELNSMTEKDILDSFYKDLTFGTGGLRGTIGAGTNRMNVYTVRRASQGVSNFLLSTTDSHSSTDAVPSGSTSDPSSVEMGKPEDTKDTRNRLSVVIARDSRIKSKEFSDAAIGVFAANGIHVYAFSDIMPTPVLSFAVRELHATAGVVITASHNPKEYNGYKVYGNDGCQITTEDARSIQEHINAVDIFDGVNHIPWTEAKNRGLMEAVPGSVYQNYLSAVTAQSVLYDDPINKSVSIVYTPLNGTGLKPLTDVLRASGYQRLTII